MSEPMMLLWIEKVIKPYVATAPTGIVPLLFLDSYQVYKMASPQSTLGVEVIIIEVSLKYQVSRINLTSFVA